MNFTKIVIVIVFFLLDKGHEAKNMQKECLLLQFGVNLLFTDPYQLNMLNNK